MSVLISTSSVFVNISFSFNSLTDIKRTPHFFSLKPLRAMDYALLLEVEKEAYLLKTWQWQSEL
jgi:hypothetical protein